MKKKWTAEMEIFIKKNYKNNPDEWLAKKLGCSRRAIERKRLERGLKRRRSGTQWTEEEVLFVRNYWKDKPDEWLAKKLGINQEAVMRKRLALGLKRVRAQHRGPYNRKDGWTEIETEYLKMGYGKVSNKRLSKVLKRPLGTVYSKLNRMGLTGSGAWIRDEYEIMILDEVECAKFLELEAEIRQMRSI